MESGEMFRKRIKLFDLDSHVATLLRMTLHVKHSVIMSTFRCVRTQSKSNLIFGAKLRSNLIGSIKIKAMRQCCYALTMTILLFSVSVRAYEGDGIIWKAYYNDEIIDNNLQDYDKERLESLKESYNLDWYLEYCGDPSKEVRDISKVKYFLRRAEKKLQKKCKQKLDDLSEEEAKSLVIYKTNFSRDGKLDSRINDKVLEIIADVRENRDKWKYGNLAEFIYSEDVLLGIIFMQQSKKSLGEYKWAYAKDKVRMMQDEYGLYQKGMNQDYMLISIISSDVRELSLESKNLIKIYATKEDITESEKIEENISPTNLVSFSTVLDEAYKDKSSNIIQGGDASEFRNSAVDKYLNPISNSVSSFPLRNSSISYPYIRELINSEILPSKNEVYIEDMINYFDYDYPVSGSSHKDTPLNLFTSIYPAPWNENNKLLYVGVKADTKRSEQKSETNFVFIVNPAKISSDNNKILFLKDILRLFVDHQNDNDTISIIIPGERAEIILEPTLFSDKNRIVAAIDKIEASGRRVSRDAFIKAYTLAAATKNSDKQNQIILLTNSKIEDEKESKRLEEFIRSASQQHIIFSVIMADKEVYNDDFLRKSVHFGRGVLAYADNLYEAKRLIVDKEKFTARRIARNAKFEIEFNPYLVKQYRLIGYNNFAFHDATNNEMTYASDIFSGDSIMAIYEIIPQKVKKPKGRELRYSNHQDEYAVTKLSYLVEDSQQSRHIVKPIKVDKIDQQSQDLHFATAVAAFSLLLSHDLYLNNFSYDDILALALKGDFRGEYSARKEFVSLVRLARHLIAEPMRSTKKKTIYSFNDGYTENWSHKKTYRLDNGDTILGRFTNNTITLNLDLPSHKEVTVEFDFWALKSWDGTGRAYNGSVCCGPDIFMAGVNRGPEIVNSTFSNHRYQNYPNSRSGPENDALRGAQTILGTGPNANAKWHFSKTFRHNSENIEIYFRGKGLSGMNDESWGIDNVSVEVRQ